MLKIAALAPMPSARVRMATAANPGLFARVRTPIRRSCRSDSMAVSRKTEDRAYGAWAQAGPGAEAPRLPGAFLPSGERHPTALGYNPALISGSRSARD